MTFTADEFAAQPPEMQRLIVQLQHLRTNPEVRAKLRRLEIFCKCCKEEPLVEVLDTDPPCVLMQTSAPGHVSTEGAERRPWSGYRRGDSPIPVRLSIVEEQAERGLAGYVWCRHRRWRVASSDVTTTRGRRDIETLSDNSGHIK